MKTTQMTLGCVLLCVTLACNGGQGTTQAEKTELKTATEKLSYALGQEFGQKLRELNSEYDTPALTQGVKDALENKQPLIAESEVTDILREFKKTEGERYMEENMKKDGVETTGSGLQYRVITEGNGPKPKTTDRVTVHYRGTLIDGRQFDSSYDRGQPATFPLNKVIPGWTEGLQLMSVGSKYEFVIPSELAYGSHGAPGSIIGPDATLIFEVELLKIN